MVQLDLQNIVQNKTDTTPNSETVVNNAVPVINTSIAMLIKSVKYEKYAKEEADNNLTEKYIQIADTYFSAAVWYNEGNISRGLHFEMKADLEIVSVLLKRVKYSLDCIIERPNEASPI